MMIAPYIIAVIALIIILKIFTLPFKIILKFVTNSIIGGIALLLLSYFGIIIAVNWWTVVLTGLFGAPGLVIALIITMLM